MKKMIDSVPLRFAFAALLILMAYGCKKGSDEPLPVKDGDGNIYTTVKIGTMEWLDENLKTTSYNDGTPIPLVSDNSGWNALATPGYCWYNNDEAASKNVYGALYNWYAVNTGKLCPAGWRVASDNDWKELELALGMSQADVDDIYYRGTNEGSKLAGNSSLWIDGALENDPGFGGSGFGAVPGGFRVGQGMYLNVGNFVDWWTSTEDDDNSAWYRGIWYNSTTIYRDGGGSKKSGFAVRCVKK